MNKNTRNTSRFRNSEANYFQESKNEVLDIIHKHKNEGKKTVLKLNQIKQDLLRDDIKRKRCYSINDLMKSYGGYNHQLIQIHYDYARYQERLNTEDELQFNIEKEQGSEINNKI